MQGMKSIAARLGRLARRLTPGRTHAATDRAGMAAIFADIHRRNVWGETESVSGRGSTQARAADFLDELVALLETLSVRSLLDAPCGDFNWAAPLADAVEQYVGMDVVPELIDRLQRANTHPGRRFVCGDISCDPLPRADAILCRDGLVHFSFEDIRRTLGNFQRSGARYLLTTTFVAHGNRDIATGDWRPLNFEAAPFRFPPPLAVVDERCTHTGGRYRDKRLALWAFDRLPLAGPPG